MHTFLAHIYLELALYLYLDKVYHRLLVFIILADPGHDAFPSFGVKASRCSPRNKLAQTVPIYIYIYICQESGIKNGGRKKQQFDSLIQCEIQFDPVKRERRRIKGDIRLAKTVNRERREKNGRRRNRGYDIFDSFRFVRS